MKKILSLLGLIGGLSAQYAALAGSISPRVGLYLGGVGVIAAAVGDSVTRIAPVFKDFLGK